MTQFSELQDRVLRYGFADSKYRSDVKVWLNEAQRQIASRTDMRLFFEALQFSTAVYSNALPSDFLRLHPTDAVNLSSDATDWTPLEPLELRDFDDLPTSYGTPTSYTVAGTVFYLYPYPTESVSITLIYFRHPVDMDTDTDEPEIPDLYEDVMVAWALKRAYEREQDFQAAAYHGQDFQGGLDNLMGQAQTDTVTSPKTIRGMWGGSSPIGVRLP